MDNMKRTFRSFKLFTFGTYSEFKGEGKKREEINARRLNVNNRMLLFLKKHAKINL